jgi:GT2 family glycosyltransferase
MSGPLISVIVVTRNRKEDLYRCLESVAQQRYENIETIVVDNGSTDGTAGFVRERYPRCTLCISEKNAGTSITRNAAIKLSSGEYIWFLDSDAYITDHRLGQVLVSLLEKNPNIGAVGGEGVVDTNHQIVGVKRQILERNGMLRSEFLLDLKPLEFRLVECLPACNLFARRKALQEIGGFDPLFFFFLEDTDLTYRMRKAGYQLGVLGRMPVIHNFSERSRARHILEPRRNRNFLVLKNFTLWKIFFLPILDLMYLCDPNSFKRTMSYARKSHLGAKAFVTVPPSGHALKLRPSQVLRAFSLAFGIAGSLAMSYVLFVPHIPAVLRSRWRKTDHISTLDLSQFRVERASLAPKVH